MAISVKLNHTDSPISGVTALSLARGLVNFGSDFCIKQNEPGEAVISNKTSPLDAPERFRFAVSPVKDVYQNTDIDPTVKAPSKRGTRILCQLTDTYTLTDSVDATYRADLPLEGHIVLTLPNDSNITSDMLLSFIGRLVSGLFETGSTTADRLTAQLRGTMLPKGL